MGRGFLENNRYYRKDTANALLSAVWVPLKTELHQTLGLNFLLRC